MRDVIYGIVFMSIVFGLAALVLTALDKVALKQNMSPVERERFLARRSTRFHSAWAWPILVMALIALPIHALGLEKEPMGQRYFVVVWPDWLCSIFCSDDALLEIRASQRNIPATMSDSAYFR